MNTQETTPEQQLYVPERVLYFVRDTFGLLDEEELTASVPVTEEEMSRRFPRDNILPRFKILADAAPETSFQEGTRFMLDGPRNSGVKGNLDRMVDMVETRFGLRTDEFKTYTATTIEFGVTRERIRQIVAKYQAMLRRPNRVETLDEYLKQLAVSE